MLNSKHTFYILAIGGQKAYIPEMKDYCGNFIELEDIIDTLSLENSCTF
jgi:hypothetical protein